MDSKRKLSRDLCAKVIRITGAVLGWAASTGLVISATGYLPHLGPSPLMFENSSTGRVDLASTLPLPGRDKEIIPAHPVVELVKPAVVVPKTNEVSNAHPATNETSAASLQATNGVSEAMDSGISHSDLFSPQMLLQYFPLKGGTNGPSVVVPINPGATPATPNPSSKATYSTE